MPGDEQRRVAAVVLLDQGEGEVDAGGDTGRGGDRAVPYEDRLRIDVDVREPAGEGAADGPVGGDPPWRRSQATTSRSVVRVPSPPGTTTVAGDGATDRSRSGTRVSPLDVRTGSPPGLAVTTR
jgi:hypothetical protein